MNDAILQNLTRAIRGNRPALHKVLETYKGLSYAMAFRKVRKFPEAQRIAQRAWMHVAVKIRKLSNPENFMDLLGLCIGDAQLDLPPAPAVPEPVEEHSVMKTEKVQSRKALRQAFQDFDFPEAQLFFLRYVEGMSVEDSAQLLGIETTEAAKAVKKSLVILAFKAGFAGPENQSREISALPAERLIFLMAGIDQAENRDAFTPEMEQRVKDDPALRKELDAVKLVLGLTSATFGAHRLPLEFERETLAQIAIPEPSPLPALPFTYTPPRATGLNPRPAPTPSHWALVIPGLIAGLVGTAIGLSTLNSIAIRSGWYTSGAPMYGDGTFYLLVWGLGIAMSLYARPPIFTRKVRYPAYYFFVYGMLWGSLLLQVFFLAGYGTVLSLQVVTEFIGPGWLILTICMVVHRIRVEQRLLEHWMEECLRVLEHTDYSKLPPAPSAKEMPPPTPTNQPE